MRESLHAEWTKLRTLASTFWLLLATAALTVAVSAAAAAAVRCPSGGRDGRQPRRSGLRLVPIDPEDALAELADEDQGESRQNLAP